ncbi:hypothetical protein BDR26DRAFT_850269, partial [Obelidium mucronatum]
MYPDLILKNSRANIASPIDNPRPTEEAINLLLKVFDTIKTSSGVQKVPVKPARFIKVNQPYSFSQLHGEQQAALQQDAAKTKKLRQRNASVKTCQALNNNLHCTAKWVSSTQWLVCAKCRAFLLCLKCKGKHQKAHVASCESDCPSVVNYSFLL